MLRRIGWMVLWLVALMAMRPSRATDDMSALIDAAAAQATCPYATALVTTYGYTGQANAAICITIFQWTPPVYYAAGAIPAQLNAWDAFASLVNVPTAPALATPACTTGGSLFVNSPDIPATEICVSRYSYVVPYMTFIGYPRGDGIFRNGFEPAWYIFKNGFERSP